ncbi:NADP-dependent malic enzyme [uncultured Traorella sp.]|uniref:NAD(P)-dependent malic enzyme n=1 Tax=uncultured Traorella sp. TaxID=1929048 RepID=UPI0025D9501B|nr:NADP-dependent malic enzyme [uncultured Traorella sp.]
MELNKKSLEMHKKWNGKLEVVPKMKLETAEDLSIAYTPGVAAPCIEIKNHPNDSFIYTARKHTIAVISDGSAVLGLGNIGAEAAMPVMEGKCALFKALGGIDAIPLCINTQDTDKLVEIIASLEASFGGINLEDIAAPRCFEIEKRLQDKMKIPVFHDDQHGTAIVVCAALVNALRLVKKDEPAIVINGAGSAGCAIASLILKLKLGDVILVDRQGILHDGMELTTGQRSIIQLCNHKHKSGDIRAALKDADVFIGVSTGHIISKDMIASMHEKAIVFAMANPIPEIEPEDAKEANAYIIGTGRSDHPNQINNLLAFPGIFKGALDAGATRINDSMKIAAVYALAHLISEEELRTDYIIASPFDKRVVEKVSEAVKQAAIDSHVIRQ